MHRLLRSFSIWLLVLALPAQGHAVQAMLLCGPAHHRAAVSEPVHDHGAHGHAEHGGDHAHANGVADAHTDAHTGVADAGPHHSDAAGDGMAQAEPSGAGTCSACAACCSAAAIPSTLQALTPVRMTPDYGVAALERHDSRAGGGLERPPRTLLA